VAKPPKPELRERAQKAAQSQHQNLLDQSTAMFERGYYDAKAEKKVGPWTALVLGLAKVFGALVVLYVAALIVARC
jgi:hypothetical protein